MKRFNLISLLFLALLTLTPTMASADIGGLTKCSESPAFTKRLNASVKKLEQRLSQYEADSPPALALQQQVERTKARFDKYSRSDLLCGTEGLPHLVADGTLESCCRIYYSRLWVYLYFRLDWLGWSKICTCGKYNKKSC